MAANSILYNRYFVSTLRKNCSRYQETNLEFEALEVEGRDFA